MKRFVAKHSPLFILAALCIALGFYSQDFRTPGNLQSVAYRTAVIGVMAVGQLLVILTAGIDLSVGSVAAFSGVAACLAMKYMGGLGEHTAVVLGGGVGVLTGLACGGLNGIFTTKGRIPPFIVTLGMMMAARGATLLLSGGQPVYGLPESFAWLGGTVEWWVPVAVTVAIALFIAAILNLTRFGRGLYAVGGNMQAARLSGLNVDRIRIAAFALSGMFAGFAGVMLSSRTSIASPNAAEMYELDAIAACVIGGASLMGGEGSAIAAIAGALIMMVLRNVCNLEGIDVYWQPILVGGLIIALVFYDNLRKRKAGLLKE